MATLEQVSSVITDQNLDDLTSAAWYGGITYWADEVAEPDGGVRFHLYEHDDRTLPEEAASVHKLTDEMLKRAFYLVLERQVGVADYIVAYFRSAWDELDKYEPGVDMGDIDAEAADVWVQVATFGELIYG